MGVLVQFYDYLASEKQIKLLTCLGMYDERVYEVVERYKLAKDIVEELPEKSAAIFLSRGMCYDCINKEVIKNFMPICMMLSQLHNVNEGAVLASLIGNCGLPEQYRMQMFNFSETYRHMILSESYFPQRAVLRLLSYIFCDDILSDAVAQLQYKSDILNHINKTYMVTPDFVSWRFSVRCMSFAGGYNEDRSDVEETEWLTRLVSQMIPDFLTYSVPAFFYAKFRFYPQRVRGITPRWLVRQRAFFSATCVGALGVYCNSWLEYRLYKHRVLYELRKSQEYRRRRGARKREIEYVPNNYFDNLQGVTNRLWSMQLSTYLLTTTALTCSLLPLTSITFPKFMGDVAWRHPFLPRLFPALLGMHAASRCLVPFVFAPFTIMSFVRWNSCGVSLYDKYVLWRNKFWHRKIEEVYDLSNEIVDVDKLEITNEEVATIAAIE